MKKKKDNNLDFDPEVLRMYLMGATNPVHSNKINFAEDVIDLHLDQSQVGKGKIPAHDALFYQLEQFEAALDRAIAAGKMEFRVVHGHGKGKLKQEIYKLLDKHPQVRSYENTYHSKYGYGSTLIILK
jgi:DNA-nicking Smr family endonuclease